VKLFHGTLVALISLGCAQVAAAQISSSTLTAFNQAVETGDASAIEVASTNLINEAIANPDDPDALIAAYEAALKLCDIDCAAALPGAEFALGFPATGQHPIMAERELLAAFASFTAESTRDTRRELLAALNNMEDPTLLSARAFMPLYADLASRDNLGDAAAVAGLAVRELRPVRSSVLQYYLHAAETHATTSFLEVKTEESHEALVRWNAELRELRTSIGLNQAPEWLRLAYWRSEAWIGAANAFYASVSDDGETTGRNGRERVSFLSEEEVNSIYGEYSLSTEFDPFMTVEDGETTNPVCVLRSNLRPRPRFPSGALRSGTIGYVLLHFDLDEDGDVISPSVVASVPPDVFDEMVEDTVSRWRFEVDDELSEPDCYFQRSNIVYPISFEFQ